MRRLFTLMLLALVALPAAAQTADTVVTGSGYANDVFYSLRNGQVAEQPRASWDLAFMIQASSSILANTAAGVKVYKTPYPAADWANVDSTGNLTDANALYNDATTWFTGALNTTNDPGDQADIGWGIYDFQTHVITGDSVHLVQDRNGDLYKLLIERRQSGVYTFRVEAYGSGNTRTHTLAVADYPSRNFGYFNFAGSDTFLNREPENSTWDLLFTQYTDLIPAGPGPLVPYGLSGVLHNAGVEVAQVEGVDVAAAPDTSGLSWDEAINTIGSDWKRFDMASSSFQLQDSLVYYIRSNDGSVWKLWFTDFGGSADGRYVFNKTEVGAATTSRTSANSLELKLYPNPATTHVDVLLSVAAPTPTQLTLVDANGRVAWQGGFEAGPGFQAKRVALPQALAPGAYRLLVQAGAQRQAQTLLIQR